MDYIILQTSEMKEIVLQHKTHIMILRDSDLDIYPFIVQNVEHILSISELEIAKNSRFANIIANELDDLHLSPICYTTENIKTQIIDCYNKRLEQNVYGKEEKKTVIPLKQTSLKRTNTPMEIKCYAAIMHDIGISYDEINLHLGNLAKPNIYNWSKNYLQWGYAKGFLIDETIMNDIKKMKPKSTIENLFMIEGMIHFFIHQKNIDFMENFLKQKCGHVFSTEIIAFIIDYVLSHRENKIIQVVNDEIVY